MNKYILGLSSALLLGTTSCNDFEELNIDKTLINESNVQVAHLLNKSIFEAQMNPEIAERIFVLTWKRAARYERGSGFSIGTDNDGYNTLYFSADYGVAWLNSANNAINVAKKRIDEGTASDVEKNIYQMSRIWRAYLISELADCFGPIPADCAFDGTVPAYQSVNKLYVFILDELKDASSKLDTKTDMSEIKQTGNTSDLFYNGDMSKWQKYANSLRLRLAMRLSESDSEDKAKEHVVDIVNNNLPLIKTSEDIARVQEKVGWSAADGVMSRTWNAQPISSTMNNILLGLGGVEIGEQLPANLKAQEPKIIDQTQNMGIRYDKHLVTSTNDPSAGFFFPGLPKTIDPRALVMFNIPGYYDKSEPNYTYPDCFGVLNEDNDKLEKEDDKKIQLVNLETGKIDKNSIVLKLKHTWNTWVAGKWDKKGDYSTELLGSAANFPSIANKFRTGTNYRIWFGDWETYFLLAEAAVRGWISGPAEDYYNEGIKASFVYNGVEKYYDTYIASKVYNRVGTSVAFNHTEEAMDYEVSYTDGYTREEKTMTYKYPKNSVYKGNANNDHLTKIITQKYIANCPYLPLEAWNDHRRLGLPFFENQAVEVDYVPSNHEVPLNKNNYTECKWEFYPKRMRYPANLEVNNKAGFDEALKLLGGENKTNVPLYWCMPKE